MLLTIKRMYFIIKKEAEKWQDLFIGIFFVFDKIMPLFQKISGNLA